MNENEEMLRAAEAEASVTPANEAAPAEPTACNPLPQTADDAPAVCTETDSPAEAISEATDTMQPETNGDNTPAVSTYHAMTKEQLIDEMKKILADNNMNAHREVTLMKQAFFNIRKREADKELLDFVDAGNPIENFSSTPCELENKFKNLVAEFKERRARYLEEEDARRQSNLALKIKAIDGIRALMEDVDNINRNYPEFQRLQQDFKDIKDIPQQAENEVWKQYQGVVEQFYDLLKLNKELRDLDFKKNLEAKRHLIAEAEELQQFDDALEAARRLQDLHARWRETGPVAKELRDEIWEEFRQASSVINKRHQEYYDRRKAEEQANEEAKTKLCEEAEAIVFDNLQSMNEWQKLTDDFKALQARWSGIGFASRKTNNALYNRFRQTCDKFFTAKAAYFKSIKDESKANLEKKIALCEKAEAIAAEENATDSIKRIKALQDEWKTVGRVERKHSEEVWQRFLTAVNAVFDKRKEQTNARRTEEKANLQAKRDVLSRLNAIYEETEETGDSIRRTRQLQDEWRAIGFVPIERKEALNKQYREIIDKLSEKLGIGRQRDRQQTRRRNNDLVANASNPRAALTERIRQRRNDLNTYENNLGFFNVKSSAGNSMVKQLQTRIESIKADIADLEKQLAQLPEEK